MSKIWLIIKGFGYKLTHNLLSSVVFVVDAVISDEGNPSELILPKSASDNKLHTDMLAKELESADLSSGLEEFSPGNSTGFCCSLFLDLVHMPVIGSIGRLDFLTNAASFLPSTCKALLPA